MTRLSEQQVLEALKTVDLAEDGRNLVSAGMISGLVIRDGHVGFTIEVDPKDAPHLEPLRKAAERAVDALPHVLSVSAMLTASRTSPAAKAQNHAGHDHGGHSHGQPQPGAKPASQPKLAPGVRAIVAVASGKGGVGKSTTTVNLACALGRLGLRVGLLDADVYGPSQPRMLGLTGKPESPDGKLLAPMPGHGIVTMSMGMLVPEETPMIWRGPMVMGAITQMLRDVAWGELDIMLVDMPPGTGDAQLTLAQSVPLAGAVIVSTPQDIALIDARKGLNMFKKVDVPVLGIIENMSYFCCPNCGHRSNIFSHGGARQEALNLGTEFLGEIPLDIAIRETSDAGQPIVMSDPSSPHSAAYQAIAARIWAKISVGGETTSRLPPKIVIE